MKRTTTFLFSLAIAATTFAVPAKRQQVTLTRADGTTVVAYLVGDEHCHYYQAVDTDEILFIDDNGHCYSPSKEALSARRQHAQRRSKAAAAKRAERAMAYGIGFDASRTYYDYTMTGPCRAEAIGNSSTPFELIGKKKALCILVEFSDKPMTYTREEFDAQINEVGYKGNSCYGSVHDYFDNASYGQFDLEFDVVGPVKVSKKYTYYGTNDTYGNDKYPATMVAEACLLAHEAGINFADYDWDNDGEAEMVVCVYAGYGEAQNAPANTIWPHQWTLSESLEYGDGPGALDIDGTTIDSYLVLNELNGSRGTKLDGIGTFCHEYSHSLGLPDLYDTNRNDGVNFGMENWSLMDNGSYGGDGYRPTAYGAYERMFCHWLTPTVLSEGCEVEGMREIASNPDSYIIYNEAQPDEYYLLQNMQQVGWNEELPGHGMLVMHIDYDQEVWYNNIVNNDKNHRCCTIVNADNNCYTTPAGLAGDPYPGTKRNTSLTDTSLPAATLFNRNIDKRKFLGKPIVEIAENFDDDKNNGTISFTFNGGANREDIVGITSATLQGGTTTTYNLNGQRTKGNTLSHGITITAGRKQTR